MHRIMLTDPLPPAPGGTIAVEGEEAHHAARSKRLEPGDRVELLDGQGSVADGEIVEIVKLGKQGGRRAGGSSAWAVRTRIIAVDRRPPTAPALGVLSAVPKGPRLEAMVDQLSQVGAASWSPLASERSVVDPREGKLHRLGRVASESAKQAGRAWTMSIGRAARLADALGSGIVVADASGEAYEPSGASEITLLVGPEGGWAAAELEAAHEAGATVASFGVHTMRIETAAPVAAGIVLEAERGLGSKGGSR
ncbi:MAG: RsmE family RNA methyltransferase [Planctomycetota bacterium]